MYDLELVKLDKTQPNEPLIHIYCDESGSSSPSRYLVIGSLWVPSSARLPLMNRIRRARITCNLTKEMKWTKVSPRYLTKYQAFLQPFFSLSSVVFNCIVIDMHEVSLSKYHNGNRELFLNKQFYNLIRCNSDPYLPRGYSFYVYRDAMSSLDAINNQELKEVLNNKFLKDHQLAPIKDVRSLKSHEDDFIQLADLLTGAVASAYNRRSVQPAKASLRDHVASQVCRKSLRKEDMKGCPKINVWLWRPNK